MNKKIWITLLIIFFGNVIFLNKIYASEWNLPGINLITRSERGADESLRYEERSEYQTMLKSREDWANEVEELKKNDFDEYLKIQEKDYKKKMANQYLIDNFAKEYSFDEVREYYNGHKLRTPEYITHNKTKIIIHHGASNNSNIKTKADAISYLKKIYKFHALTRGRGDIGYNFIIDPFGNIYEGRAGGEGTVGMHAKWNNTPSLGIMLMGNFEIQKPSDAQIKSLINLVSILSAKYDINPNDKTYYNRDISTAPYLESNLVYTIAGHKDAGYTACPGKNLYNLFPYIRKEVSKKLLEIHLVKNIQKIIKIPGIIYSPKDNLNIQTEFDFDNLQNCSTNSDGVKVDNCYIKNGQLTLNITKTDGKGSGIKRFILKNNLGETKQVVAILLWQKDLDSLINVVKNRYLKKHTLLSVLINKNKNKNFIKINDKISIDKVKQLLEQKVQVLLYELSTDFEKWDLECEGGCTFIGDSKIYNSSTGTVYLNNGKLILKIKDMEILPKKIDIYSSDKGLIKITNYNRKSYSGIPRNSFRGMLTFEKGDIINKTTSEFENKYILINTLDLDDYMKGIVESNDTETIAKNKAMTLVSKMYVLFYMTGKNKHPSIPDNSNYNAIDDPDLFQKYVGAGLENTLHKRYKALDMTKNQIILYDNYVPILPYFHCSPGFTFTAKEKRGRNDTPYLKSRLDIDNCKNFEGHGVGMSGKGAEWRAKLGFDYQQLIKYYYDGVNIVNI